MGLAVIGILGSMATGAYTRHVTSARNAAAIGDIGAIKLAIDAYRLNNNNDVPPATLAEIKMETKLDPWGNPYVYLNFAGVKGNGGKRKDHNLVPINSDFDLYSKGADGKSSTPLTAKASHDDIILANNGKFVGLAEDY